MSRAVLEVCGVSCERGERLLFENLSFRASPGTVVRIRGRNGTGKTSLIRIIAGLARPLKGQILWENLSIEDEQEDYHRKLCYIGHKNGLKNKMSARENLAFIAGIAARDKSLRLLTDALEAVGLMPFADIPTASLSQGQCRRAALAKLWLSREVPLWLLDEPFSALDAAAAERLRNLIVDHVKKGGIVILITHQEIDLSAVPVLSVDPEMFAPKRIWGVAEEAA